MNFPISLATDLAADLGKSLLGGTVSYLNLWHWFHTRLNVASGRINSRKFNSVTSLWDAIFRDTVSQGDEIQLQDVFLTEWIPRSPGLIYLPVKKSPLYSEADYGFSWRQWEQEKISDQPAHFGSWEFGFGDRDYSPLGLGSVRLPTPARSGRHIVLGVTGPDPYCCDFGIPVLTTPQVYAEFLRIRRNNKAVSIRFKALLGQAGVSIPDRFIPRLGITLPEAFQLAIQKPLSMPDYYLSLSSLLDVRFLAHDTHPGIHAWTFSSYTGRYPLRLAASLCDPSDPDSIDKAVDKLLSGELVTNFDSKYVVIEPALTDFDGQAIRFRPRISLKQNPLTQSPKDIDHLLDLSSATIREHLADQEA